MQKILGLLFVVTIAAISLRGMASNMVQLTRVDYADRGQGGLDWTDPGRFDGFSF